MSTHQHSAGGLRHRISYVDQRIVSPPLLSGQDLDPIGASSSAVLAPSDHDSAHPALISLRSFVLFGDNPGQAQRWLSTGTEHALEHGVRPLLEWAAADSAGVVCRRPMQVDVSIWQQIIARVHLDYPDFAFVAWTPGLNPRQIASLIPAGFSATCLSLPWWDGRATWLLEEYKRLSQLAPVLAPVVDLDAANGQAQPSQQFAGIPMLDRLWMAAFFGDGILMTPSSVADADPATLAKVQRWLVQQTTLNNRQTGDSSCMAHAEASVPGTVSGERIVCLTGPLAQVSAFARIDGTSSALVVNPDREASTIVDWNMLAARLPDDYVFPEGATTPEKLPPGGLTLAQICRADRTSESMRGEDASRIAIEHVTPAVDNGLFAAKACVGDRVCVQASIFSDGHERISASVLWRSASQTPWQRVTMQEVGNDVWEASFYPRIVGSCFYIVQAWRDEWASFREYLGKKVQAGQEVALEIEEGRQLLTQTMARMHATSPEIAVRIEDFRQATDAPAPEAIDALLSTELAQLMQASEHRPFQVCSNMYPLTVDRRRARYASWYELFPRSQGAGRDTHGTFLDVVNRLPDIAAMGFDVLYFPPIHPIGRANRKGRNNALRAEPDDPGSPYAIGSEQGGHDALHPELGEPADFRMLLNAAQAHGMEIAMDFAIQCSPDHPWLTTHPDWFDWRADGSLRYAENPPKRYEDIVNPDFYDAQGRPRDDLWAALRDIVLFWAEQGVSTFRVDNPHTKPLPFWQWMIAEVKARYPQVVFLSEAFTRPRMMYRLGKIGFSQSYTYFTWRNTKQELESYLSELNAAPVADFFRPNFFVNTPDINPWFLQDGGRAAFLIRAALATTLSGVWGMYQGFELCEATALPGKEEYLNSEKYEIRQWDMARPGNIVTEITQLNHLRRLNPALQSHLGVRFHHVDNGHILFFTKSTREADSVVIVAISLDPHTPQAGTLQLPLWLWGVPDEGKVHLHDLWADQAFELKGQHHRIELTPERPFVIWRLLPSW